MRQLMEAEATRRTPDVVQRVKTLDEVLELLRQRLAVQGARRSYLENCESMQRIHVSPLLGSRFVDSVDRHDIERLVMAMLKQGLAPKTVRNVASFLHAAFELAEDHGWVATNPVARAARPRRRRGDTNPDLQLRCERQHLSYGGRELVAL